MIEAFEPSDGPLSFSPEAKSPGDSARPAGKIASSYAASALLHTLAIVLFLIAAKTAGDGAGQRNFVKISLVAHGPPGPSSNDQGSPASSPAKNFEAMQQRLTANEQPAASMQAADASASTRQSLAEILGERSTAAAAAAPASGGQSSASTSAPLIDDPYSRASVSYRGDDPVKTAHLQTALRGCLGAVPPMRIQLLLDANGRVLGRPTVVGIENERVVEEVILRVKRCGPMMAAATPGPPRSYQLTL